MGNTLERIRRVIAVSLQLVTGIGGFWLVGAWRNASLFAGLWLVLAALHWAFDSLVWYWIRHDPSLLEIPSSLIHAKLIYLVAVLGLLPYSLGYLVKRKTLSGPGWLAQPALSVILGLMALAASHGEMRSAAREVAMYMRQGGIDLFQEPEDPARPFRYTGVQFADSTSWGHPVFLPYLLNGAIRGRVLFEGKPVQARVKAYLGDHYRTPVTMSDSEGYFLLPAPRGHWEINRISLALPMEKALQEEVTLAIRDSNGQAPAFDRDIFGEVLYKGRLAVESEARPDREQLTLLVRRHLDVTWPVWGRQAQPANLEQAAIRWKPVAGAAKYRVEISELTRDAQGMASGTTTLERTVAAPELPLRSLPTKSTPGQKVEYFVQVEAYSPEGELLTLSKSAFPDTTFELAGGLALVRELDNSGNCRP